MLRLASQAMRTRFEIVLADARDASALRAAGESALADIAEVEERLSRYQAGSDVYRLNHAGGKAVCVAGRTVTVLEAARQLARQTDGAFDPTVTALLGVWGGDYVPSSEDIRQARQQVGIDAGLMLDLDARTARLRAGMQIDPGAWGKGYALDLAAETLREAGIAKALLHGGTSTVVALDAPSESPEGWGVAVQHPLRVDARLATVQLRQAALSVSAVHGRTFYGEDAQGKMQQWGHVLDPRTGYPVEKTVCAAVVTRDGLTSDALSTALLVVGIEGMQNLAVRFPDAALLVAAVGTGGVLQVATVGNVWQDVRP